MQNNIEDFDASKKVILKELENFVLKYDNFTKRVSPKHHRSTGHDFHELMEIRNRILTYTEISPVEEVLISEWDEETKQRY